MWFLQHPHLTTRNSPRLVDGEWSDEDVIDPLTEMFTILTEKRDRALTQRWGVWLTRKDSHRALKVIYILPLRHILADVRNDSY